MLFIFVKIKFWKLICIVFFVGLVVGYFDIIGGYLSLFWIFVFFLFFLVGYFLKKEYFYYFKMYFVMIFGGIFIVLFLLFIIFYFNLNDKWFLGFKFYVNFVEVKLLGLFICVFVYLISFGLIVVFFSFIFRKRLFFIKWGKNILYVYLLYGFFIKFFCEGS